MGDPDEVGSAVEGGVARRKTPGGGRKPRVAGAPAERIRGVRFAPMEETRLAALADRWGVKPSEAIRRAVAEAADREGIAKGERGNE